MNEGFALHARLFTRKTFADASDGQVLLAEITAVGLRISRFGSVEPLCQSYTPDQVPAAAALLARDFTVLLRGAKPRWEAYIAWQPQRTRPWFWTFDFAEPWKKDGALDTLVDGVTAACLSGEAVFAAVALSDDWRARHDVPNAFGNAQRQGANLEPGDGLPGIYWYTFFGAALVRHFGRDTLLALEGVTVRHDEERGVALLAYPRPDSQAPAWRRAREQAAVDRLGPEYFFDPANTKTARVPIPDITDGTAPEGGSA